MGRTLGSITVSLADHSGIPSPLRSFSAEQQPKPCNTREHAAKRQKTGEIAGFFHFFRLAKQLFSAIVRLIKSGCLLIARGKIPKPQHGRVAELPNLEVVGHVACPRCL